MNFYKWIHSCNLHHNQYTEHFYHLAKVLLCPGEVNSPLLHPWTTSDVLSVTVVYINLF